MTSMKRFFLALTPMGAAAYLLGGGTFGSIDSLLRWAGAPETVRPPGGNRGFQSLVTTKKILLAAMLVGAAGYLGFGGTWSSFSAETSNNGSSIASGTLTMSNQVNSSTACLSANGTGANNVNSACGAVVNLTNVAPGVFGGSAKLTITNTGSIDASKLYVYAPYVNTTLSSGISGTVTSLPVAALTAPIANLDQISVTYGSHTQTFTASGAQAIGATSIAVSSLAANYAYPSGSVVADTSSDTTASNADCYDTKTTVAGTTGATKGTDLNFNPTTGNPLCATLLTYIQETTGGKNYCWVGKGSSPENSVGLCTAPISVAPSTTYSTGSATTSLAVSALNGNVLSGDSIVVTEGTHTQTFTASGNATFGATAIPVASQTPNFAYDTGATITDTTALSSLNSDTTDTISNFDTGHPNTGRIQLYQTLGTQSTTLSAGISGGATTLTVPALAYAIPTGTQISIGGANAETVQTTAPAAVGATSLSVTAAANAHSSGVTLGWAGIDQNATTNELTHYNSGTYARTFYVGVYLPAPAGTNQNALQGLQSTFGLTWHIDQ